MRHQQIGAALLAAFALAAMALPVAAGPDEDQQQARKDLERARQEVEKARAELQKATRELARSMAKVERDNPKVQYFEYMTDPKRAMLGVLIPDDFEDGEMRGVRLQAVTPGSGAEKAGLKAGDLLTAINGKSLAAEGKKVSPQAKMKEVMRKLKAGDEAKVEFERDGRSRSTTVTTQSPEPMGMMPPMPLLDDWLHEGDIYKAPMADIPWMQFRGPAIRGLELAKLDEDLGAYFKTGDGVLVVKAPKEGTLGLKSGDVIQKIDGVSVSEPVTVLDKLRSRAEEQSVKLEIVRQGSRMELRGTIPVASITPKRVKPVPPVAPAPPTPPAPATPPARRPKDGNDDEDGAT
ncbi:MAG: PDZ domain-containing protein [Gammaproteobacteria bacterium]